MKYRGRHQARRKRRIVGFLIAVAALALIACPFVEPYLLQVESVTLTSDDLPADIARLKIRARSFPLIGCRISSRR